MDVVDSPHKGRPPSSTGLNHDVPRRRRRIPGRGAQNCAQPAALGAGGVVMFVQDRPRINGSAWPCAELRTTGGGNLCRHAHRCSIALVLGTVSVTGTRTGAVTDVGTPSGTPPVTGVGTEEAAACTGWGDQRAAAR